jgi:cAMP-dependent protein kinase regulator
VIAKGEATLWALDRISFRTILLDVRKYRPKPNRPARLLDLFKIQHTSRKRRMYESFLLSVPILASLEGYERAKIADALESRTFQSGELVIREGESGDEFYIIENGTASVEKSDAGVIGELKRGDYFGGELLSYRLTGPRQLTDFTCFMSLGNLVQSRAGTIESCAKSRYGQSWWPRRRQTSRGGAR